MRSVRPLACALRRRSSPRPASSAGSARQTVFRSTVDVIAVDVQVVDSDGNPIGRIGPSRSRSRSTVSAARSSRRSSSACSRPSDDPVRTAARRKARGRTFVLAIDAGSFEVGTERAPIEGAQTFVQHLDPSDRVGLFVYPAGHADRPDDAACADHYQPGTRRSVRKIRCDRITT